MDRKFRCLPYIARRRETAIDSVDAVICNANPAKGSAGFILKLTKPLPKPSFQGPTYPRPWLVKLADKITCEIQTGTIALVAGLEVPYDCSDSQELQRQWLSAHDRTDRQVQARQGLDSRQSNVQIIGQRAPDDQPQMCRCHCGMQVRV
jgi:hypothetical protein